ncbi:MAG TPA: hypothetical protein VKV26_03305 [Dehalococcoidia bacterium]|nr:hypothetical protein [Dehalococcoidia bacterium]
MSVDLRQRGARCTRESAIVRALVHPDAILVDLPPARSSSE